MPPRHRGPAGAEGRPAMSTVTFGILGDVIFEMVMAGAPLPPGVHAPNRLDATFAITCTEEEAQAIEVWLLRHQEKAEYRAAADLIQRVLRENTGR